MLPFSEILRVLVIRDQLLQGWKILFFIICGALVVGSMIIARINVRSAEITGTVTSLRSEKTESGAVVYLIVRLDSGETVEARNHGSLDYRPGQRAALRQVTTNFFGFKKYEFKQYLEPKDAN